MDVEVVQGGSEVQPGTEATEPTVEYEIDQSPEGDTLPGDEEVEAAPAPQSDLPSSPQAPTLEQQFINLQERNMALERQFQQTLGSLAPLIAQQQAMRQNGPPPPKTLEQLKTDPNTTVADLFDFINWQNQQNMAQVQAATAFETKRGTSEQSMRTIATDQAMGGPNRNFDYLRAKHLEPMYRENPHLQQAVLNAVPENPALAEYLVGFVKEAAEKMGGEFVPAMRAMWDGLNAKNAAARDVTERIGNAQRQQAKQIVRAGNPGAAIKKKLDPKAIWSLSDDEFRKLDQQIAGM